MRKLMVACGLSGACLLPTHALADWSGMYAGVSAGSTFNTELQPDDSDLPDLDLDRSALFGAFIGAQTQNGNLVYGGELAFARAPNAEASGNDLDYDIYDAKARFGYAFGNLLGYTAVGLSNVDAERRGEDYDGLGANFGLGVDYLVGENFVLGAEYLIRRAWDGDDDIDYDADSLSLRASYKF